MVELCLLVVVTADQSNNVRHISLETGDVGTLANYNYDECGSVYREAVCTVCSWYL